MIANALRLSFFSGLLALAAEICWFRLFSYSLHATPTVVPFVLGWFLLGLAAGALLLRQRARTESARSLAARCFVASGLVDAALATAYFWADPSGLGKLAFAATLIFASGLSKGAVLTSIADQPAAGQSAGRWAGSVVTANILGATLGPILITYLVFDHFGLQTTIYLVALASTLVGITAMPGAWKSRGLLLAATATLVVALSAPSTLFHRILETGPDGVDSIDHVIQNRHGLVHVSRDPNIGDVVFGANLYDGRVNLDPGRDINGISRAYRTMAYAKNPRRILMVGLGSGSWLEVVRSFREATEIVVVELNPAYRELMSFYPELAGALSDPRIQWHYTDGRRWLRQHPNEQFDAIILNTTFSWRAFATNLLSHEFFTSLAPHLKADGVIGLNATGSVHVLHTFATVYPQSVLFDGYLLGPFVADAELPKRAEQRLTTLRDGALGKLLEQRNGSGVWASLANRPLTRLSDELAKSTEPAQLIDEDNLITEFRYGHPLDSAHFREQFEPKAQ